jgi:anti-sigma B factor antagonist
MSDGPDQLGVDVQSLEDGKLVRITGEVDLRTSPQLRRDLLEIVADRPERLVIDLGQVSYMDSSGVGTLVEMKRMVERKGGKVILAAMQPRVRSVFEITQLDKFFTIVDDADEASQA